jgi:hypothetical protein
MQLVIMESPYAGDVEKHTMYARECMKDCLKRGESPYASHLLLTQVLDDTIAQERELGINAGLCWGQKADKIVVYTDLGISKGMLQGINLARDEGRTIEFRKLYEQDNG